MSTHYQAALNAHQSGDLDGATAGYKRALIEAPADFGALHLLGVALYQREDAVASARLIRRALAGLPGEDIFLSNLAAALVDLGDYASAAHAARLAVILDPAYGEAHINLGNAVRHLGDHQGAADAGRRSLIMIPLSASARSGMAASLDALGCSGDALIFQRSAIILNPANSKSNHLMGLFLNGLGKPEAKDWMIRSLHLAPRQPRYLAGLAGLHRFTEGDPWARQLEFLRERAEVLPITEQLNLYFGLAKMYGDLGKHQKAFEALLRANKLKRAMIDYDEAVWLAEIEALIADRTPDSFPAGEPHRSAGPAPIFIIGLPRSGTTLLEQILASHSQVHGAGELPAFSRAVQQVLSGSESNLTPALLRELGEAYLALRPQPPSPSYRWMVDKMPGNLLYAGLIHRALPGAKIILARRNLVDTCLSCFSKNFLGTVNYTYDLGELGRYAAASARLMDHWEAVLPQDALLPVHYEDVVSDFETQVGRILEFCGLDWEDSLQAFHKTQRSVKTASVNQVRKPLYKTSVGKARPDAESIRPLLEALGEEGL